ncbi:MAG: hypothetical protein A2402_00665 [Candidatus Staskawiczbacteria bacterium RIFOXYC1_FULL_37_43]|nr:MAG: hypothetical protein A2813_01555 [Candidatus Staskawiczbacteria bacterium RIFCSPHIGHO2_01_FULL_37_17]OGZ71474.1 MAG: hypothetical protein A2891_01000 [Candidatus Staskawiczbacteria bacterium RIFCSPLOWO2_01_FULL_37_19]OGZ76133.1 MAG: hypothetical protein A2205_03735 [Candidatus Staskawiczbacteria bacterium RIFOXYA1_FULL_37_15]OGZ77458.1 MAG: hypothetical protein A2280_02900 [Candidatus Staskawiczbacteria bacterium RIFOXYA12_FULL_37_10]OGZ80101.1 MAG: hypothetical protein A2353_02455 [Can
MKLPEWLFWLEWAKKMILDPFWWLILFLIILWVPFLRVWWWVFLPIMLQAQLKAVYLWWAGWDFFIAKRKWVLLEITPPKEVLAPFKAMEDVISSVWPIIDGANFREIWCEGELSYGPEWCSWEIASIEGKIHYYLRVGQHHRTAFESALFGHYPDIEINEAPDYTKLVPQTVPNEEWDAYGEDWELRKTDQYPIKTYEKFFEPQGERIQAEEKRLDPIISLLEGMSKLGPGEHYWVQFTSIPVSDRDEPNYRQEGQKIVNKIARRPEKKETTFLEDLWYVARQVVLGPEKEGSGESAKYSWERIEEDEETGELKISLTPGEREVITEVENKLKKPAWRTNIRGLYVAKRDSWNASNRVLMRSYMGHFLTDNLNSFGFVRKSRPKVHFFWRQRRGFLRSRKMFRNAVLRYQPLFPDRRESCPILSSEEMATMFHFPLSTKGMLAPALTTIESKKGGPPPNLPI